MTVEEMVEKYGLMLTTRNGQTMVYVRNGAQVKKDKAQETLKAAKAEIIAYLLKEKEDRKNAYEARQAKVAAIPGLKEIETARDALFDYHESFDRAFEKGDGFYPSKPNIDLDALYKKYPQAAAYFDMQALSKKENYELSSIGDAALEMVINGDWEKALEYAKAEKEKFNERHMYD